MKYLINDTHLDARTLTAFDLRILDPSQMTAQLQEWEGWSTFNKQTTLIIFPGQGAQEIRQTFPRYWFTEWCTLTIKASRFWWPGSGYAPTAVIETHAQLNSHIHDIIIIDDVISSGVTTQKVREQYSIWNPQARWHALTWIIQTSAQLRGFTSWRAAEAVGSKSTKIPINSLSTLLSNSELAENYAQRNFPNPEAFLAALDSLR